MKKKIKAYKGEKVLRNVKLLTSTGSQKDPITLVFRGAIIALSETRKHAYGPVLREITMCLNDGTELKLTAYV